MGNRYKTGIDWSKVHDQSAIISFKDIYKWVASLNEIHDELGGFFKLKRDKMETKEYQWYQLFDYRQKNEMTFADMYAKMFNHGTDGHHRLNVIADLRNLLNNIEENYDIDWELVSKKF